MVEAVLVEEFAGEGTDRRVETPRSAEKEASIGWNGVVLAEQVLESRGVAAPRMATLDGLLELLGIAEKHHVSGGGAGGDSISQGELAGFVDNESVDEALRVLPCPGPDGARRDIYLARRQGLGEAVRLDAFLDGAALDESNLRDPLQDAELQKVGDGSGGLPPTCDAAT